MAALISTNIGFVLFTFLPPILWLIFYLREDKKPEPKYLLVLTFFGGIIAAFIAIFLELIAAKFMPEFSLHTATDNTFYFFLVIALIEEVMKYAAVRFLIISRSDFDEPVDAMIYMMTSALGFAAIENALFLVPLFNHSILSGVELTANRFLGANLLHALSSGIVGFFLARAFFSPHRHHFIAIGVVLATILHAAFNYLIILRESVNEGTIYIILLLFTMAIIVFIDFERLKQNQPTASG